MREHEALSGAINGSAVTVHRGLGPGFLESVYEEAALAYELGVHGIPFDRHVLFPFLYRGTKVGQHRFDLVADGCFIVELKTLDQIAGSVFRMMRSYLHATGMPLGLILNFGAPMLEVKRLFAQKQRPQRQRSSFFPVIPVGSCDSCQKPTLAHNSDAEF